MEIKTIKLLFENEINMEIVSKIIDKDRSFLYSLLRLSGCKEFPKEIEIKLGIVEKEKNK